jgi:hypothetical protein
MIINHATNTNSFIYCTVYQGPNELTNYYNSGDGHYHRSIYLTEGSAEYTVSDSEILSGDETYIPLESKILYDIAHTKGKYVVTRTNSIGAAMIMFNPIPETKELKIEIIDGPINKDITTESLRTTVVCITGPITVKNKTLHSLQYAVVFTNTSTSLELPENSICALITG